MLHSFLFAPFATPTHHTQYEEVRAALAAEPQPGPTVLLGNFSLGAEEFDAVVIRPHSITTLFFTPGGLLTIPSLPDAWQFAEPAPTQLGADNPFARFQRQQPLLAEWLGADISGQPIAAAAVTGVVLFAGSVTFGPDVEQQLRQLPAADGFQLLRTTGHLSRQLWQLTRAEIDFSEAALHNWFAQLVADTDADTAQEPPLLDEVAELVAPIGFWEHKAQQLWRWLGAEDIPLDTPYGYQPADAAAASHDEKQRLEQIRQQVRAEVLAQNQAAAAREAEREQVIRQLQEQLRHPAVQAPKTAALQARLAAEMQEKTALQEAIRTTQAESTARNALLDARIEELGQLMQQLQTRPVAASVLPLYTPAAPSAPSLSPTSAKPRRVPAGAAASGSTWQLQWNRVAVVAAVAGFLGWGVWGAVQLTQAFNAPASKPTTAARRPARRPAEEAPPPATAAPQADSVATVEIGEETMVPLDSAITPAADSSQLLPEVAAPDLDDTDAD